LQGKRQAIAREIASAAYACLERNYNFSAHLMSNISCQLAVPTLLGQYAHFTSDIQVLAADYIVT